MSDHPKIEDRPIIFIAQSLGGFVLRSVRYLQRDSTRRLTLFEALISAAACHKNHLAHHKHVELSTVGLVYLGTPHQGSDKADVTKTMLGVLSLVVPTNTEIVNDIRALIGFLLVQQQQYRPISNNWLTYYGYETKTTPLRGGSTSMIVSKTSVVPLTLQKPSRSNCLPITSELPSSRVLMTKPFNVWFSRFKPWPRIHKDVVKIAGRSSEVSFDYVDNVSQLIKPASLIRCSEDENHLRPKGQDFCDT